MTTRLRRSCGIPVLLFLVLGLAACDPVSFWHFETLDGDGATNPTAPTFFNAVDPATVTYAGSDHVFYVGDGALAHAWWNGRAWSYEKIDGTGDEGPPVRAIGASQTAVDGDVAVVQSGAELHVFYRQENASGKPALRHAWYAGAVWRAETLDGAGATRPGSVATSGYATKAVISDQQLHVFTIGADGASPVSLRHLRWTGTVWAMENLDGPAGAGTAGRSTDPLGIEGSLAVVTFNGAPHVFYRQEDPLSSPADEGRLRHAWYGATGWRAETLDGAGATSAGAVPTEDEGAGISAVVYGGGVHVFSVGYNNVGAGPTSLRHTYWNGTRWTNESIDGVGGVATGKVTNVTFSWFTATALIGGLPQVWSTACTTSCVGQSVENRVRHASWTGTTWTAGTVDGPTATTAGAVTLQGEGAAPNGATPSSADGGAKAILTIGGRTNIFYTGSFNNTAAGASLRHAWYAP